MGIEQFLKDLMAKIDAVDLGAQGVHVPASEKEDGDVVIGVIEDDYLKKLYNVFAQSAAALATSCESAHKAISGKMFVSELEPNERAQMDQHQLEHKRHGLIGNLFWQGVREAFPTIAKARSIAIRRDWTIVTCEDPEDSQPSVEIVTMGPFGLSDIGDLLGNLPPELAAAIKRRTAARGQG